MSKLIKEIMDALNAAQKNKTEPYDRQGEVKRIEGKIAWVRLEGSDRETPVQMTIACDVGDTVQARIGGGSAWLTGNLTAPPTDDKKANQAISMATTIIQQVKEEVDEALEDLDTAGVDDVKIQYCLSNSASSFIQYGSWSNTPPEFVSGKYYWTRTVIVDDDGNVTYGTPQYSQDTQLSVETDIAFESNNNHFWHNSSGAYVTTADKDYTSGYATRITSSGILQSYNNKLLSGWTNSGIAFYDGDGTTASNSTMLASFGSGGVNLYGNGYLGASVTSSGVSLYQNNKLGASLLSDGIKLYNGSGYLGQYITASGTTIYDGTASANDVANISSTLRLGRTDKANVQIPTLTETQTGYHSDIEFYYNGTKNGNITSGRSGSTYYTSIMANGGYLTINDSNGTIAITANGYIKVGAYKILTIGTVTTSATTINKDAYVADNTVSASKTGYTPIGIVGMSRSGSYHGYCHVYEYYLSGDTIYWSARNFNTSNNASLTMSFRVLYVSSTQGV